MFKILENQSLVNKYINNSKIMVVRPSRRDIDIAVDWAAAENWNPGINDADIYYSTDPSGFYMGVYKDRPIGFIFSIGYDTDFTVAGVFIVQKEFRNKRIGVELGLKFLEKLNGKNIAINAVQNKVRLYEFVGFKPAFDITRFFYIKSDNFNIRDKIGLLKITKFDDDFSFFGELTKYDRLCFPTDRRELLKKWIYQPQSFGFCVTNQENSVCGYGVLRKAVCGYRFEPLYADNYEIAEIIFLNALNHINIGEPVFIDIPMNNAAAVKLANNYGFKKIFNLIRMYSGDYLPLTDSTKLFGMFE